MVDSSVWRVFSGLIAVLAIWGLPGLMERGAAAQQPKAEYQFEFKGLAGKSPEWGHYGPSAEKYVKFEPEGVRITLPAGHVGPRPAVGLATRVGLKGDFEVTVSYEILQEPERADVGKDQTRFTLDVVLEPPRNNVATLSRRMTALGGPSFLSWARVWDEEAGKPVDESRLFPAKAKTGRLRLVRRGGEISYWAAEDDTKDFTLLAKFPFRTEEAAEVRFLAVTGGPKAALDVRVASLQIRADGIPKPPTAPPPPKAVVKLSPPSKQYAQEYFQAFKTAAQPAGWEYEKPDSEEFVKFEAAGVHFTMPAGVKGESRPKGLKSAFGIKGDFEITMSFEILAEPLPADAGSPVGTRINVGIIKATPHGDVTNLSRMLRTNAGCVFTGWANVWNEEPGKMIQHTGNNRPTKAMVGRLRLVRSGNDLYYGFTEGLDGDFQFFKKYPFGGEDVREVRIIAGTGGEKATLDARVTDLSIRADAIPDMPASGPAPGGAAPQPPASRKGWLAVTVAAGLAVSLLAAIAIGAVLFLRSRNRSTAPLVSLACPECGKKLKVKPGLAAKTLKCPQCGNAVKVPTTVKDNGQEIS